MSQPITNKPETSRFRHLFKPQQLIPSLTSGFVTGLLETALAISFATLIFAGPLAEYRALGIGLALLGTILSSTAVALFTSLPGTLGGNQEVPAAIMAVIVAEIALLVPAGSTATELLVTVLVAIALTSLLTGIFFLVLGYFKIGNLVRFLPYPVVGGFLAGTGWLLVSGALGIMITLPQNLSQISDMFQPLMLLRWLPGVILALFLLFWTHRSDNFLILPGILIGSMVLFYLIAWGSGISLEQLQQGGWLAGPFPNEGLWRPFPLDDLDLVHWTTLAGQAGRIATIVLVSTIGLLLNAGGVELATKKDMDLNRELRAAGFGNILSGLVPGLVGFQQLSLSAMNFKLRANNRITGLVCVLICIFALFFGASLLSLVPQILIGGLLLYLGLSFLVEWVIESWFKLPKIDYMIIISVLLVTVTIGFLQAVVLGLLLTIVLFVVGYSWVDIVRLELTGVTHKSRVVRPRQEAQILRNKGDQLYILQLRGFIFFGTADQLLNRVRQRLADEQRPCPTAVYLDFSHITGLDSTAILSFNRMRQITEAKGVTLILTGSSPTIHNQLEQSGFIEDDDFVRFFPSLDSGVQWGEERILSQEKEFIPEITGSLQEQLAKIWPRTADINTLFNYLECLEVNAGERLIAMGDQAEDMFIIGSGQVTAQIPRANQPPIRLETIGSGHVVGEIGFYLGKKRTAEVVVDKPGVVYRLSLANLQHLEKTDLVAATTLHRLIIHLLAERLSHLTESFNELAKT